MRTKALLLTAAIGAAGIATSMAQGVFSVNAVGYVNVSIPKAGGGTTYCLIANPLNNGGNTLNEILPTAPDGTVVYAFRGGAYSDPATFIAGFGWFEPNAPLVLKPGEGVFVCLDNNLAPATTTLTFVGEVPQGNLSHAVPGNNAFSIQASEVPQALPIGDAATANTLRFPAGDGDTLYFFDCATQRFKDAVAYIAGFGWFDPANPGGPVAGPTVPVAGGFFVQKAGPTANWDRQFSVNN